MTGWFRGRAAKALLAGLLGVILGGCQALPPGFQGACGDPAGSCLLRVNVTRQAFYAHRPWQPEPTVSVSSVGAVLTDGRVLVSAETVADHRFVELEKIDTGEKCRAVVAAVDYEADLALVVCPAPGFMAGLGGVDLASEILPKDRLEVMQVQPGGRIIATSATVETVELADYPYGNRFLVYRLNGSVHDRHGNLTLPVLHGGRLAGLLRPDGSQGQTLEMTPALLVAHFLSDMADGRYDGFPISGIRTVPADDPQLRRWAGLPPDGRGVLIENLLPGSPADQAAIRPGDVLVAIDDHLVDSRGYYMDPRLGRIEIAHLIRCGYQAGDAVKFTLRRQGRPVDVSVRLDHLESEAYLVPPYRHDRPPRYYVLNGLVLQELSVPFLRDFGGDWRVNAPIHLLHYYENQYTLRRPAGERIVILNAVLPTWATIGYEQISSAVVERINGRLIHRLDDVPPALETPVKGFHRLEIDQPPFRIYLDAASRAAVDEEVRQRYNLPRLFHLDP
jgi:hypothetical protein